jgi:kinesin family protein 2/24
MEALEKCIAKDIFPAADTLSERLRASQGQTTDTSLPDVASLNLQGDAVKESSKSVFEISVSFVELLGKKATDLLAVANAEANAADGVPGAEAIPDVPIMENKVGIVN